MAKHPWSRGEQPPPKPKGRWRRYFERHVQGVSVVLMVGLLLGFVLYPYMLVTVPSGQVGVLWKRFSGPGIYCWCILPRGTVLNPVELRDEGLHLIWPWDKLYIYDLRLQSTSEKYNAISQDGVNVAAEINFRYQLKHDSAAVFHKFIGPVYVKTLLSPDIGSQTRKIVSKFPAQQVYVSRENIEEQIRAASQNSLGDHLNSLFQAEASEQLDADTYKKALQNAMQLLDTFVLSIELPDPIVAAINRQTEQFYMIREFRYRAEREQEETKRKQIEANGIAAFQRTVSQGISESYLRWRGIEATLALAQSPNSKIVVIGSGKDGLPIILGNVDGPSASPVQKPGNAEAPPTANKPDAAPKTPQTPTPAPTDKTPPAAPSGDKPNASLDLTDIQALLSRLTDALRPTANTK